MTQELKRVAEIENAILAGEMTAEQVFTQMKQLVYRQAPCHAFCEANAFKRTINALEKHIERLDIETKGRGK